MFLGTKIACEAKIACEKHCFLRTTEASLKCFAPRGIEHMVACDSTDSDRLSRSPWTRRTPRGSEPQIAYEIIVSLTVICTHALPRIIDWRKPFLKFGP